MMTSASQDASRHRMLRGARFALHVITVVLTVATVVRAANSGVSLVLVSIAAALFLGWYGAGASFSQGRAAKLWLAGLTALWLVLLVISAEFVWLSFPLLLLAGHLLRVRWAVLFAVFVLATAIVAPIMYVGTTSFAHVVGPLVGGGFALAISLGYDTLLRDAVERERLIASLLRAQQETAQLQDELVDTQREAGASRERTRLARDLHDTIAQELSSISLLARTGHSERMPQIDALSQKSLTELRRIVAALDPVELEQSALAGAVDRMLNDLQAQSDIRVTLDVADNVSSLPTAVEVALLRVAQSALANVRQHSQASNVAVRLGRDHGDVTLEVSDDGVGFDSMLVERQPNGTSYGLAAMRARLRELGGDLRVSAGEEGTLLRASVPVRGESASEEGLGA